MPLSLDLAHEISLSALWTLRMGVRGPGSRVRMALAASPQDRLLEHCCVSFLWQGSPRLVGWVLSGKGILSAEQALQKVPLQSLHTFCSSVGWDCSLELSSRGFFSLTFFSWILCLSSVLGAGLSEPFPGRLLLFGNLSLSCFSSNSSWFLG